MNKTIPGTGILVPPDFPAREYESFFSRAQSKSQSHAKEWDHLGSALNAITYRFRAMCDDSDSFTSLIGATGSARDFEERYMQERHLYGFFCNGFSVFESFFYAMFAVGTVVKPSDFPLTTKADQRRVSPVTTRDSYNRSFQNDPVLAAFRSVLSDRSYVELKEVRNVLSHRTAPGRQLFSGIGSAAPLAAKWKTHGITLDKMTTVTRRADIARMLAILLGAADVFVGKRM